MNFYSLTMIQAHISELTMLLLFTSYQFTVLCIAAPLALVLYLAFRKRVTICLLDFTCYRPPYSTRVPMSLFQEHIHLDSRFHPSSVEFQIKILEKSGFSHETCVPCAFAETPIRNKLSSAMEEAQTTIFSIVTDLLQKNNINPKAIDILISNSSMFAPTPSLTAMVVNKFNMRSNIMSFNLSGMGCSAGITSIGLAKDLLRVHQNSLALIVSTEMLNCNWYTGKETSMLLTNCLFRTGGAAILMSSRCQDKKKAKYELQHLIRTNKAHDDRSYNCVYQDLDSENMLGVSISKDTLHVAADALKANISTLGPLVLPFSEQLRYVLSITRRKTRILSTRNFYIPNFRRAFEHFCIHAGGKSVIQAIERNLVLKKEDVEPSKMTLYRYGNTSSSSIWYELSYIEAKGRMKRGDRVWQIAFGSGFKCNSAVWKCIYNARNEEANAWPADEINKYPVEIPNIATMN
ncbi:probable 3-ketoacyl-CoA synthase 21 [Ricinus communis]|uniref:3-ketoacyl-CoA synthase n=1 Tax=Ricinus communis TaxID=3988 RepID=B9RT71_RICCO|nr:probable 3-ketoacyl-CoA synthase 21 [Ricinus communis]EEF45554.1 acyltransferase, putative [Ricinus communis]|eukprot:XP_002516940.1 probable 3-ketoacyl-CoA synthase 21 [Ricinus communis]